MKTKEDVLERIWLKILLKMLIKHLVVALAIWLAALIIAIVNGRLGFVPITIVTIVWFVLWWIGESSFIKHKFGKLDKRKLVSDRIDKLIEIISGVELVLSEAKEELNLLEEIKKETN